MDLQGYETKLQNMVSIRSVRLKLIDLVWIRKLYENSVRTAPFKVFSKQVCQTLPNSPHPRDIMPPGFKEEQDQGNTTVVKGGDNWSRPSSLESIYLETEPVAANLLAQANTSQRLESPESVEDDTSPQDLRLLDSYTDRYIHKLPGQGQRSAKASMEERLQAMPVRRELPWRPGVEPGAETETGGDSRRKQIRFGCLLATRGDVAPVPCNSCANGRGKFSVCVFLNGYFKGACASCQYVYVSRSLFPFSGHISLAGDFESVTIVHVTSPYRNGIANYAVQVEWSAQPV